MREAHVRMAERFRMQLDLIEGSPLRFFILQKENHHRFYEGGECGCYLFVLLTKANPCTSRMELSRGVLFMSPRDTARSKKVRMS